MFRKTTLFENVFPNPNGTGFSLKSPPHCQQNFFNPPNQSHQLFFTRPESETMRGLANQDFPAKNQPQNPMPKKHILLNQTNQTVLNGNPFFNGSHNSREFQNENVQGLGKDFLLGMNPNQRSSNEEGPPKFFFPLSTPHPEAYNEANLNQNNTGNPLSMGNSKGGQNPASHSDQTRSRGPGASNFQFPQGTNQPNLHLGGDSRLRFYEEESQSSQNKAGDCSGFPKGSSGYDFPREPPKTSLPWVRKKKETQEPLTHNDHAAGATNDPNFGFAENSSDLSLGQHPPLIFHNERYRENTQESPPVRPDPINQLNGFSSSVSNAFDLIQTANSVPSQNTLELSQTIPSSRGANQNFLLSTIQNGYGLGPESQMDQEQFFTSGKNNEELKMDFPYLRTSAVLNQESGEVKEVYTKNEEKRSKEKPKKQRTTKIEVTRNNHWKIGSFGAFKDVQVEIHYHYKARVENEESSVQNGKPKKKEIEEKKQPERDRNEKKEAKREEEAFFIKNLEKDFNSHELFFPQNETVQSIDLGKMEEIKMRTERRKEKRANGVQVKQSPKNEDQKMDSPVPIDKWKNCSLFQVEMKGSGFNVVSNPKEKLKSIQFESFEEFKQSGKKNKESPVQNYSSFKEENCLKSGTSHQETIASHSSSTQTSTRICHPMKQDQENEPSTLEIRNQFPFGLKEPEIQREVIGGFCEKGGSEPAMDSFYQEWKAQSKEKNKRRFGEIIKLSKENKDFVEVILKTAKRNGKAKEFSKILQKVVLNGLLGEMNDQQVQPEAQRPSEVLVGSSMTQKPHGFFSNHHAASNEFNSATKPRRTIFI